VRVGVVRPAAPASCKLGGVKGLGTATLPLAYDPHAIWARLRDRENGKPSAACECHESAAKAGEVGAVRFCLQIAGDGGNEAYVFLVEQPPG
jgi:hypothetical protein